MQHCQTLQLIGLQITGSCCDHGSYYPISVSWTNIGVVQIMGARQLKHALSGLSHYGADYPLRMGCASPRIRRICCNRAGDDCRALIMDPVMVTRGHWVWEENGAWFGIPQQNFWSWWLTSFTAIALYLWLGEKAQRAYTKKDDRLAIAIYAVMGAGAVVSSIQTGY